jgi:hypothetical protein
MTLHFSTTPTPFAKQPPKALAAYLEELNEGYEGAWTSEKLCTPGCFARQACVCLVAATTNELALETVPLPETGPL